MKVSLWQFARKLFTNKNNSSLSVILDQPAEKQVWDASAHYSMPEPPNQDEAWIALQRAINNQPAPIAGLRSKRRIRYAVTFAAVAMIALTISLINLPRTNVYSTANAEFRTVLLPDSSRVKLNCASRLSVPRHFNRNFRTVQLTGEALFEVRKGKLPFIVETEFGSITVLGTAYNVKVRDDRMDVGVISGIVRVTAQDSSVILEKGQHSTCLKDTAPTIAQPIQLAVYPAWQNGQLYFNNMPLDAVCLEIQRRFDVPVHLSDYTLGAVPVTGLIKADHIDNVLTALCVLIQKEFRHADEAYYIY